MGWLCAALNAAEARHVFLVTGDGIRWQEVFTGIDAELSKPENKPSSGIEDVEAFRAKYWDESPKARREKIMPFFWGELSKQGAIYGNRALGSKVGVKNPHRFSYPGYAEILNGQALEAVTSNDPVWSPRETVLEYARRELGVDANGVAAFGSWKIFNWIAMSRENAVFCNAGYEAMPQSMLHAGNRFWNEAQFTMLTPWNTVRHDAVTLHLALDFISRVKPRVLYLALGETDDWAHNRRYDRTIETLEYFDRALKELWTLIQSTEPFKDNSLMIVTTDHGRGITNRDWTSHGKAVPGAEELWLGVFGQGVTARGEMSTGDYTLSNVAATMLKALELDPAKFNPAAAPAIE